MMMSFGIGSVDFLDHHGSEGLGFWPPENRPPEPEVEELEPFVE